MSSLILILNILLIAVPSGLGGFIRKSSAKERFAYNQNSEAGNLVPLEEENSNIPPYYLPNIIRVLMKRSKLRSARNASALDKMFDFGYKSRYSAADDLAAGALLNYQLKKAGRRRRDVKPIRLYFRKYMPLPQQLF
ncbi:uncharacterized protein LOC115212303 [Octopus sinensis]|nr:uncharacterized protein LOC115212303 [Octopus sinensis]